MRMVMRIIHWRLDRVAVGVVDVADLSGAHVWRDGAGWDRRWGR